MKTKFFYSQAIISIAVNAANAFNIVFMLMALRLPAESFAEITSILSITFLFSVSQSSARNELLLVYKETGKLDSSIARAFGILLKIALLEGLVIAAGSIIIAKFLHFSTPLPFIIAAGCSLTYVVNGTMQGIFAAEGKVRQHAMAILTESSLRMPLAIVFFGNGYQSEDASWIMLIASGIAVLTNMAMLSRKQRKTFFAGTKKIHKNGDGRTAAIILVSTLLIGVALKLDILWAKHALTAEAAGVYGMMSFVASVLFLSSSGVVRSSLSFTKKTGMEKMIRVSYALILAICLLCILGFYVAGKPVLQWLSDDAALIDGTGQLMLFAAVTAYCFINFNFQLLSVLHKNIHLVLSIILVASIATGLFFFGRDMRSIALSQMLVMLGMLCIYLPALLHHRKHVRLSRIHSHNAL